jgi:hypothetical protein
MLIFVLDLHLVFLYVHARQTDTKDRDEGLDMSQAVSVSVGGARAILHLQPLPLSACLETESPMLAGYDNTTSAL